jgi:hypothetical protein
MFYMMFGAYQWQAALHGELGQLGGSGDEDATDM